MSGELGKASYELDADLGPLRRQVKESKQTVEGFERTLDALSAIADISAEALKQVKITAKQAGESDASAAAILEGVRGISDESRAAARELDRVRISEAQATESAIAGERIKHNVKDIGDEADRTKRKLAEVRLSGGVPGRSGVGVGPIGSGFGRVGVLGTAIGLGALTSPAAGPGVLGLLGATGLAGGGLLGSAGVLALAFDGVGKAIGGDKKAFDSLEPSAQKFVTTVRSLDGWLDHLKQTAGQNLFPGLERGLNDALSPGTLNAIDTAVEQLAKSLGHAGEEWGRYFGSPQFQQTFGPLMREGAREVETLSDAVMHLFDGLGVFLRDAIPFNEWMLHAIDNASRLADEWLHAKSATGELGHGMDEAKTSLSLVVGLIGALLRAVGALGEALYPVSKIAVKDLTDGLNWLAREIHDNQDGIREFVGGALAALVSAVKFLVPYVGDLAHLLGAVVGAMGGWKTAFEIVIGGVLVSQFAALAGKVGLVGSAAEASASEAGGLRLALLALGDPVVLAALAAAATALVLFHDRQAYNLNTVGTPSTSGGNTSIVQGKDGQYYIQTRTGNRGPGATKLTPISAGQASQMLGMTGNDGLGPEGMRGAGATTQAKPQTYTKAQLAALWVQAGGNPAVADTMASIALAESSGRSNATNYNTNGSTDRGLWQINSVHGYTPSTSFNALQNAKQAVSVFNSQGLGAWSTYNNGAYLKYTSGAGQSSTAYGAMPDWTKNTGATKPTQPTGDALLSDVLRNAISSSKNNATMASSPSIAAHYLNMELDDLEKARKQLNSELDGTKSKRQTAIKNELRSIDGRIADVNKQITTNLKQQAAAIKQSYTQKLSTLRGNISSAFDLVKAALDDQLQRQTQDYISNVIGPKFFQGTDEHGVQLQTPLEKQLADMQAVDTMKSLQDAIDQATDPQSLADAQRAKQEYLLSADAAKERAQADHDYAIQVQAFQDSQAEKQRQMDAALDAVNRGLQNGTKNLNDLANVAGQFGVSLVAEGGIVDDFGALGSAVSALASTMLAEAMRLAGVGDTASAQKIKDAADALGITSAGGGLVGGDFGASGFFKLNNPLKMAAGGAGRTLGPKLFYSGGNEDFMFSGEGTSFAEQLAKANIGGDGGDVILEVDSRELARANAQGLSRSRHAVRLTAKAVKPALDSVVSVSAT